MKPTTLIEYAWEGEPWIAATWRDFADANPDDADDVARALEMRREACIGGGAAPYFFIRLA